MKDHSLWERSQMVIAGGTEGAVQQGLVRARVLNDLSAKEKESIKLTFVQTISYFTKPRETIQGYYVRFTKLINDMRNIKMTMPRMQLNSKFMNNMLPEWSRFITEVKLNRGLKESNFDQLYAYLKQHEVHANENRTMMERFLQPTNDPLALVSNALVQHSSTENLIECLSNSLALLTQLYKSHLPQTNNQLRMSSNARNKATVQDGRVVVQDVRGQNRGGIINPGPAKPIKCYNCNGLGHIARECPRPKRLQDSDYFKDKMLLMQAQENGAVLDEEQSLFLAGEQITNFDEDVDNSPENDLALNMDHIFEADECDAFDSDIRIENLLIENENLIVNCLSTQLLYDVEKSRCLDLEADMSKVHDESKLEGECLNLQLKYQHLQESFDNNKSHTVQEAPDFNSFFKIKNLEHQIQEKDNVIRNLKVLVANVNDRSCEPYNAKDVTALIEQNDCVRVELEKVKQHYKELYDSIKITRAHTSEKTSTMLTEIESLKAQLRSKESCFTSDYVKPKVLAPGMYAIDVKPIPHPLKNNRSVIAVLHTRKIIYL
ncbi:retrovirus-related pol polyprotein from transposon TNT 1-94 [Tanacetum coccineum]